MRFINVECYDVDWIPIQPVEGFYKHRNEPLRYIKGVEILY